MNKLKFVRGSQGIIPEEDKAISTYSFVEPKIGAIIIERIRYQGKLTWRTSIYQESYPDGLQEIQSYYLSTLGTAKDRAESDYRDMKNEMLKKH